MEKKTCRICGAEKTIDNFYYRKDSNTYRNECKECTKATVRLRETGWSPEDYEKAWVEQKGCCAICGKKLDGSKYAKPNADHDHKTKKLRGILCVQCNTAIGLMKDSTERLSRAIEYLNKHT
jgi:hypothetical protein